MTGKIMTVKEVALYLKFSEKKIYNLVKSGEIPFRKIGKRYSFEKDVIVKWLTGNLPQPARRIDYETFVNEKKQRAEDVWKFRGGKLPRRRPRSKEESDLLLKMDLLRQKAWIKSGKLKILGPRKYRFNLS